MAGRRLFVTGIGTDVGKTVVSAILTEALQADYWKPVQCGVNEYGKTDSQVVCDLLSNTKSKIHAESYFLKEPMSPHAAARVEGRMIDLDKIKVPETNNDLVIEGAGGLLVPLNDKHLIVDLIENLKAEVVLVSRNYLGSINHTLLSCFELKRRSIKVAGIIFNGERNQESERAIVNFSGFTTLGYLDNENEITQQFVKKYAEISDFGQKLSNKSNYKI